MIINSSPLNEVMVSNLAGNRTRSYNIKTSAKALSILSSGVYANKIRAVIREICCNAVDSHVAAGNKSTPFDLHLPTRLEPWFAVRDYGVGMSVDEVEVIYTTYFESTKTNSNDFIGALGLGSKSPFAYTDNFAVTAVKDGVRCVYVAFIDDSGFPSITQTILEKTTDQNGVEVKFSVNAESDFGSFKYEAASILTHFELRPVVNVDSFTVSEVKYETKNIVPNVHVMGGNSSSTAIMGNICYPISVPGSDTTLGNLSSLLSCGLEIHFGIGELDFQASREGLSYVPLTMSAIRGKLVELNDKLTSIIAAEADTIPNLWDRADFLIKKATANQRLYFTAITQYVKATQLPTVTLTDRRIDFKTFHLDIDKLAANLNIKLSMFAKRQNYSTAVIDTITPRKGEAILSPVTGTVTNPVEWRITPHKDLTFVITDTPVGSLTRAKYHWKKTSTPDQGNKQVAVMSAAIKGKPMDLDGFFATLHEPTSRLLASQLSKKPTVVIARSKNVQVMNLAVSTVRSNLGNRFNSESVAWVEKTEADLDPSVMHYYFPMVGYNTFGADGKLIDAKRIRQMCATSGIARLKSISIYGVRKDSLKEIKQRKNWATIDSYINTVFDSLLPEELGFIAKQLINRNFLRYPLSMLTGSIPETSKFMVMMNLLDVKTSSNRDYGRGADVNMIDLVERFCDDKSSKVNALVKKAVTDIKESIKEVETMYPMIKELHMSGNSKVVADYVKSMDDLAAFRAK